MVGLRLLSGRLSPHVLLHTDDRRWVGLESPQSRTVPADRSPPGQLITEHPIAALRVFHLSGNRPRRPAGPVVGLKRCIRKRMLPLAKAPVSRCRGPQPRAPGGL